MFQANHNFLFCPEKIFCIWSLSISYLINTIYCYLTNQIILISDLYWGSVNRLYPIDSKSNGGDWPRETREWTQLPFLLISGNKNKYDVKYGLFSRQRFGWPKEKRNSRRQEKSKKLSLLDQKSNVRKGFHRDAKSRFSSKDVLEKKVKNRNRSRVVWKVSKVV